MNVLMFGKVPPIQGGVSKATWQAAIDLAEVGHNVDVVSNAEAMPPGFRQMMGKVDRARMSEHPSLRCHMTQKVESFSYIPWSEPFVSQLLGVGLRVSSERAPDVIIGWYFEPYGLVASILGERLDKPVILRHAGSDIGRLALHKDLGEAYRHMLAKAKCVLTNSLKSDAAELLKEAGAQETGLCPTRGRQLTPEFFMQNRLDLGAAVKEAEDVFDNYGLSQELREMLRDWNTAALDNNDPILGTYGKIGEVKGTYQLIDALDILAKEDVPFRYNAIWSATPDRFAHALRYLLARKRLKGRVLILPPVPPWSIPAFIRSCDVVAFLENRFPIEIHGPQVPREVLACGRPLILSGEIFDKVFFRDQLVSGANVAIVPDPEDRQMLAGVVRMVLTDESLRKSLGHHAATLSRVVEASAQTRDTIVDVLEEMIV